MVVFGNIISDDMELYLDTERQYRYIQANLMKSHVQDDMMNEICEHESES